MATATATVSHVDERILHPLGRLRNTIRRYLVFESLATVGLFLAIWFWAGLALDFGLFQITGFDWVQDAPRGLRIAALFFMLVTLVILITRRLVFRLMTEFSHPSLALVLEKRFPAILGDRLITAVELADTDEAARLGYSAEMIRHTITDARAQVDRVPVNTVFNWGRLRLMAVGFLLLTVGGVLWTGASVCILAPMKPHEFAWKFYDVATIWMERDIQLKNVPWPRRSYMELLDFPGEERRIGRDNPTTTIRVMAYKWVISEPTSRDGWRPLTWKDLSLPFMLPGQEIPELPIDAFQREKIRREAAPHIAGGLLAAVEDPLILPTDLAAVPTDLGAWKVDRVEALINDPRIREYLLRARKFIALPSEISSDEATRRHLTYSGNAVDGALYAYSLVAPKHFEQLEAVFKALSDRAADPAMSRRFRKLAVPGKVQLSYRSARSRVDIEMTPKGYNEFSGNLSDLKEEEVRFIVRGEDYTTPEKKVVVVKAPRIELLKRTEFRPAYLYYLPPFDEDIPPQDNWDSQRQRIEKQRQKLAGLKQTFTDLVVSLSGERSVFPINLGTDVEMQAETDKELKEALLIPKATRFPGLEGTDTPSIPLKLTEDHKGIRWSFKAGGLPVMKLLVQSEAMRKSGTLDTQWNPVFERITKPTEFDLFLRDTDGVTSKRTIQIEPAEDRMPDVSVSIDVIRKEGNHYLCTAEALLPFIPESAVVDDNGLHMLEYAYEFHRIDPVAMLLDRMEMATWLLNDMPVFPNFGNFSYRASVLLQTYEGTRAREGMDIRGLPRSGKGRLPVEGFRDAYSQKATGKELPLAELKSRLTTNFPDQSEDEKPLLKRYLFPADPEKQLQEAFDVKKLGIAVKDPNESQPEYSLVLSVEALDSNVEGVDRVGKNKERMEFQIVSKARLTAAIGREQAELGKKLDEAIKRLETGLKNLNGIYDRSGDLKANASSELTRSEEVSDAILRAKDLSAEVLDACQRIETERKVNRLPERDTENWHKYLVEPLLDLKRASFPEMERTYAPFQNAVRNLDTAGLRAATPPAQEEIGLVIRQLKEIRERMGNESDLGAAVKMMQQIIDEQERVKNAIKAWTDEMSRQLFEVTGVRIPYSEVKVKAGEKVNIPVTYRLPEAAAEEPKITVQVPAGSGLTVPAEIKIADGSKETIIPITAGAKTGVYTLTIAVLPGQTVLSVKVRVE